MREGVVLYVLAAALAAFLVGLSYRLSRRYPGPYLTFNFLYLAFFSLTFFASRPIPSLLRSVLSMDERQLRLFGAVNIVFVLMPLMVLVLYLQVRFAAGWMGVKVTRTFKAAYFSLLAAYVIALGWLAFSYIQAERVPAVAVGFFRSRDWVFTGLDFGVFLWMIARSRRLAGRDLKQGIGIYGGLGVFGLAAYNLASLAGLSGVWQPLLFLAQPAPALIWLARWVMAEEKRRPAVGDAELERGAAAFRISAREKDILRLLSQGLRNAEVAERLFLSPQTVKNQVHALFIKVGVKNRVQLVNAFRRAADRLPSEEPPGD